MIDMIGQYWWVGVIVIVIAVLFYVFGFVDGKRRGKHD